MGDHVAVKVLVIPKREEYADGHDENGFDTTYIGKYVEDSVAFSCQNAQVQAHLVGDPEDLVWMVFSWSRLHEDWLKDWRIVQFRDFVEVHSQILQEKPLFLNLEGLVYCAQNTQSDPLNSAFPDDRVDPILSRVKAHLVIQNQEIWTTQVFWNFAVTFTIRLILASMQGSFDQWASVRAVGSSNRKLVYVHAHKFACKLFESPAA